MARLLGAGAALLWVVCVLLRSRVPPARVLPGSNPAPARPRALELRTIHPIGRRILAVRLQVVLA